MCRPLCGMTTQRPRPCFTFLISHVMSIGGRCNVNHDVIGMGRAHALTFPARPFRQHSFLTHMPVILDFSVPTRHNKHER